MKWLATVVTGAPAVEPISRDEAKLYAKVDSSADDTVIDGLIVSARRRIERYTGSRLITQTIVMRTHGFCDSVIEFPGAPLQSIASIAYLDGSGASQTLSAALYREQLHGLEPRIERAPDASWPEMYSVGDAVTVTAIAGYGATAAAVPEDIRHALKILIAHFYDERAGADLPDVVCMLLADYRTFWAAG